MKTVRSWMVGISLLAGLLGAAALAPSTAHAQEVVALQSQGISTVANALIQFETATRWESMRPRWRQRRSAWISEVRAASSPQQLAALTVELETIMTWQAMYPRWRQERPGWLARGRAAASEHDVAQLLIALEAATTWNAMFENRWRPVRANWLATLRAV